jgi:hypothetical protein
MPIVKVINSNFFNTVSLYKTGGTQYIENTITFPTAPDSATIYLSDDVFFETGDYVLFDYSQSASPTPVLGSISTVNFDLSDLTLSDYAFLTNKTLEKKIILTLRGRSNVGTQYITGVLNISSPMTINLGTVMFNSAGTYTLFNWNESVEPTPFVGSISNITIVTPPGRTVDTSVSPNGCAISGNTITVKLI